MKHLELFLCLAAAGMKQRYGDKPAKEIMLRSLWERKHIIDAGFTDYYIMAYQIFTQYAATAGMNVWARGATPSSVVCYCLGLTEIDPIKYNLLFERFLNPERVTMPDIDVDFDASRREEVIEYVMNKYGSKKAVGIITFNTLLAKQVLRDVGRVLNINTPIIDELTKNTLDDLKTSYQNSKRFKMLVDSSYDLKKLYVTLKWHNININNVIIHFMPV